MAARKTSSPKPAEKTAPADPDAAPTAWTRWRPCSAWKARRRRSISAPCQTYSRRKVAELPQFRFDRRNRRPPADPVNACLSLAYAVLTRTFAAALTTVGLDPWKGLYHVERPGRPALALDLIEPFRPVPYG